MAYQWRWTELVVIRSYSGGGADRLGDEPVERRRRIKGDNRIFALSHWVGDDAVYWDVDTDSWTEKEISHDLFGAVLRLLWHSSEGAKDSGYVNLEIREEIRDGEVNMGVTIMKMAFKTLELTRITWEAYVYREKKET